MHSHVIAMHSLSSPFNTNKSLHLHTVMVGYSRLAYSRFAYSHFAYSRFAYSQMSSLSRFAYTQDFCTLPSFKGFLIKPVLICTTLMRQNLLLMVNYYCIFFLYFMNNYGKKRYLQIDKIGATINCYCIVLVN